MKKTIEEFLDTLMNEKKYSLNTINNYRIDCMDFCKYLNSKTNYLNIEYEDISKYIKYLKNNRFNPKTINRKLSALRSFYNYLVINHKIPNNPFKLIKSLKTDKRLPNYFKDEDFMSMLEITKDNNPLGIRNNLILELLLATGLRVSELSSIKLTDIDLENYEVKAYGKGRKERIVFFGKYAHESINNYLKNARNILLKNKTSEYLFINNNGTQLTDRGIRLIIETIIKKAMIKTKVSPHTFRHTFATKLLNNGCDIRSVQELLGHSNLNTTSIYTHLTNEEIRNAYLKNHPRARK